ncbi:PH domain-containing protein [Lipingzhangella sp. LS1_29]|uniref:PH domain-containing protein n=1 Tax=Lipingzhangella rawalii TaxID=2055835 RepID=A0ABU2H318_9ACTN|nr:PH domain-containing protein [Lipingzhangella rawalii]MDS1269698.1 PH domain-containing protein [Lipingzhangella rawalii]
MSAAPTTPPRLRLRPPRHRVERRAISYWTVRAALVAVPVVLLPLVPTIVLTTLFDVAALNWLWALVAAVAIVALGVVVVMPQWRFRVHRWEVTDDAVYTLAGWLWQEWRVAPMSRIQTVDTQRGPVQRAFRLSTVTVTTASAAGALRIDGLDAERAAEVAEQLTDATQAVPGDAT